MLERRKKKIFHRNGHFKTLWKKKPHKTGLRSEYFKSVLYLPMYFVHST